jgi:hypothetical protein
MLSDLPRNLSAALFAITLVGAPVVAHAMGDEEFVGPFASWANVKSYGAAGDGVTDDTAAIQKGLNALGPDNPTLYFPAGTYRITQTLTLHAQQYVNVMGQDPATTTILWGGASGGTMLLVDGVAFSRVDRFTFEGSGTADTNINQTNLSNTGYFDTGNEYADDYFQNAGVGYRCGWGHNGCAESSLLRDHFSNLTSAGVLVGNQNALDIWIWYSLFQNNALGATACLGGAGAFHVFNSVFQGSTVADICYGNTSVFNFRNNYSIGSNAFIQAGGTGAPDNVTIQGNTILDTRQALSVWQNDPGPVVFIDNIVRTSPTASSVSIGQGVFATATAGPAVLVGNNNVPALGADLFSMGNTFTIGSGSCSLSPASPAYSSGHCHEINDQAVARSTINPTVPTLPGTPPNNNRQIFEASPTGSGTACTTASPCSVQQAITNAANAEQSGAIHPVAHIAAGAYNIISTITVPATVNSGIQIIGDGNYSQLTWTGIVGGGPVMRLLGPSKVILRDFYVEGYNSAGNSIAGLEIDNADQPGSRVFMEQAALANSQPNLFVDGLDYTNVELHDTQHFNAPTGGTSINVTGGSSAAAGLWQGGVTNLFAGLGFGNYLGYQVANGAHVIVRDTFNDGGGCAPTCDQIANVTGTSILTYAGSFLGLPSGSPVAVSLNNFQGTAALLNLYTLGDINITGNSGTARVLGAGLVGPSTTFFSNTSSPAAATEFPNSQADPTPGSGGSSELPEQGCCDATFLNATINQVRTEPPTLLAPLASGVTDARLYRVSVDRFITGIHAEAGSVATPPPTASLSASPTSINAGQSSTLSWSSTNATSCAAGGFTAPGTSGSAVVTPSVTTTYSITCSGSGGSTTAAATVNVTSRGANH